MTTNYPNGQDTYTVHTDNNGDDVAAADVNDLQDAVSAIESVLGYGTTQPTSNATPSTLVKRDANGIETSVGFAAAGLTGATAASRYVGATASGAPTTGTFAVGDFVMDQTGMSWVCTVAGSPGTWIAPIVDSGSNSNGYHVKFGDGTMICYGTTGLYPPNTQYATGTINLPVPFVDTNYSLDMSAGDSDSSGWGASRFVVINPYYGAVTASSFQFKLYTSADFDYGVSIHWRAVGKWK